MMDEGARLWLAKTVRKHYWRVSSFYDPDDLIQEGYEVYFYVRRRYPAATEPRHIMALFKRVFMCRITDLANKRTRSVPEVHAEDLRSPTSEVATIFDLIPAEADISAALVNFIGAPQYVLDALALFATPEGRARLRSKERHMPRCGRRAVRRETLNDRLLSLLGLDPEVDVVGPLRALLEGGPEKKIVVSTHALQREVVVERVVGGERRVRTQRLPARCAASAGW